MRIRVVVGMVFFMLSSFMYAQEGSLGELKNEWTVSNLESGGSYSPSISISSPTGFSGDWLNVFLSLSTVNRVRYDQFSDGVLSVGLGLGDHREWLGLSVSANAHNIFGSFGETITFDASISREIASFLSLSLGVQNFYGTGKAEDFLLPNYYLAGTSRINLHDGAWFNSLVFSLGVGNGAYNREVVANRILLDSDLNFENFDLFGSLAFGIHRQINLIGNFNGQNIDAGLSIVPFSSIGLIATGSILDILSSPGDGLRLGLSLAYNYKI